MPKVAIYSRVSTIDQYEEGYSIEGQLNSMRKYCQALEWDVYKEYVDPGFSGGSLNRPAIQQLIAAAKEKRFDTVLVYKLDRLSRSTQDTLYLVKDVFTKHGIAFVSLSEKIDTGSPMGNLFLTLLSAIAEFEREQIKERMHMGKVGRARSGKAMGWATVPFGYTYDKVSETYQVNDLQAKVVRQIFDDYLAGISITKLVDKLNQAGHIAKPVPWSYRTIRQVLGNVVYTGRQSFAGKVYEGSHKRIISDDTYQQTQKQLKLRQLDSAQRFNPRPFRAKFMLSGLLRCKECGSAMGINKAVLKHDDDFYYYRCVSSVKKRTRFSYRQTEELCHNHDRYLKNDLEKAVIKAIRDLQLHPAKITGKGEKDDNGAVRTEIKQIDAKLEKLVDLYLNGDDLSLEIIKQRRSQLVAQREALQAQLKQPKQPELALDKARELLGGKNVRELNYEEQKRVARALIAKIEVGTGRMRIHWRFKLS